MTMIISSSMVALLSLPRMLLFIPRREDENPNPLISDGSQVGGLISGATCAA